MTRFKIEFLSSAAKEFRDLSIDLKQRIGGAIESLQSNPLPSLVFANSPDISDFIEFEWVTTGLFMKLMSKKNSSVSQEYAIDGKYITDSGFGLELCRYKVSVQRYASIPDGSFRIMSKS